MSREPICRPVRFRNGRGLELAGVLHGEPSSAMAISCHGMLATKDGDKHVWLADELAKHGLCTLRFDFSGRGDSEGDLFDLSYSNEVDDLESAIGHLVGLGAQRIGLFGSSMGGAVALLAASRDERICAVATLAAVGHPELLEERRPDAVRAWYRHGYVETDAGRIGRGFLEDSMCRDVLAAVATLRAPILVAHGELDEVVPASDAHDLASVARNASLEIVLGADHAFSRPEHLRPIMRHIAAFLLEHLHAPEPTI